MRIMPPPALEAARLRTGHFASATGKMYGAFDIPGPFGILLAVISSGVDHENGWEHVSVSTRNRPPNWKEMCVVKELFWDDHEAVVQFHPAKADHINIHPNCLHIWRPIDGKFPMPPGILVGPKVVA